MMNTAIKSRNLEETPFIMNRSDWPLKLFFLTFLLPSEISANIGTFRLTPNLIYLILFFFPSYFFLRRNSLTLRTDWVFLLYGLSMIFSLSLHHGVEQGLESGGVLLLRSVGAYLVARAIIRNHDDFVSFVKLLGIIVFCLSFITVPESLYGKNFLRPNLSEVGERLGLTRAYGTFDHPILYGVFCASSFSLYFLIFRHKLKAAWIVVATFMSVSTGALVSINIQLILICWNHIAQTIASRWKLFGFLIGFSYVLISLLSNRTPVRVILHRLTFNAETAYYRLTVWEWGTKFNVAEHPWFGIGFNDWVRPEWMISSSIDNFWLLNMMQFGLPAFFLMTWGIFDLLRRLARNSDLSELETRCRTAWFFSVTATIVAGATVHFWNSLYVWFFFLLGSGSWMGDRKKV